MLQQTGFFLFLAFLCYCNAAPTKQQILAVDSQSPELVDFDVAEVSSAGRPLQGRFLHISGRLRLPLRDQALLTAPDLHPDPFYKYHASVKEEDACHRGRGPAGILGAETTDCDSPISLVNATFNWIRENLKDKIDFIIWTGDSARHDNDENLPRTERQVEDLNKMMVNKFVEVFGKEDNINDTDPTNDFVVPIVPTWGNNDILPHNIFLPGPNKWTKQYLDIWRKFIPEAQRHGFERGGWFFVEVIPNKLAVFSINTLYFFDSNSAVDGCADKSEPGYEQMEWLRIQLRFLRERGMKAIMMGHVPPARTESKMSWDETCWQKYTLWMHQYRDVIVGSVYGHMNIDHFMLQDSEEIDLLSLQRGRPPMRVAFQDEFTAQGAADYLTELRDGWSQLPDAPHAKSLRKHAHQNSKKKNKKPKKSKEDKFLEKIGGPWGERYSLSLVSPSIVPNYYPTIRVVEYNISGLEVASESNSVSSRQIVRTSADEDIWSFDEAVINDADNGLESLRKKKKKRKPKKPKFTAPSGPSKSTPPGPAYSPQTLSWLGYTQYFANLTVINNDFINDLAVMPSDDGLESAGWKEGKHHDKEPKDKKPKPKPKEFKFEVEYDTRNESVFKLPDLTVRSYLDLASRIGHYKPKKGDHFDDQNTNAEQITLTGGSTSIAKKLQSNRKRETQDSKIAVNKKHKKDKDKKEKKKKKKKKKKDKKKRKAINRVWFTFVRRAFVGARTDQDLHDVFGQPVDMKAKKESMTEATGALEAEAGDI